MKTLTEWRNEIADWLKANGVELDEDDRALLFNELAKFRDEAYRRAANTARTEEEPDLMDLTQEQAETLGGLQQARAALAAVRATKKNIAKRILALTSEDV